MGARVLVVEDDADVSGVVSAYLESAGFVPRVVAEGTTALEVWRSWQPGLVVLDIMLPTLSGLEVLRRRRADGDSTPVIVLSALGEEEDRVVGLEVGADDYVVKPFSPRELVLRVRALLRRDERVREADLVPRVLERGSLRVDTAARTVDVRGERVLLTAREFELLAFLMDHAGEAFGKRDLLRRVWGWDFGDTSTVAVHVRRLRGKVEVDAADPVLVVTVPGAGYRFATDGELEEGRA